MANYWSSCTTRIIIAKKTPGTTGYYTSRSNVVKKPRQISCIHNMIPELLTTCDNTISRNINSTNSETFVRLCSVEMNNDFKVDIDIGLEPSAFQHRWCIPTPTTYFNLYWYTYLWCLNWNTCTTSRYIGLVWGDMRCPVNDVFNNIYISISSFFLCIGNDASPRMSLFSNFLKRLLLSDICDINSINWYIMISSCFICFICTCRLAFNVFNYCLLPHTITTVLLSGPITGL